MDKKLISEITRINDMMGVKNSPLILESIACPFCDAIMKQVSNLASLASKNSDSIEFKFRVNELLERVKNSEDLTLNQRSALQNVITKLKEVESVSDDVSSFKLKVQDAINKNNSLSDVVKTKSDLINYKVMSVIDYSKIYNDPKLVNYYFENDPTMMEFRVAFDSEIRKPNFKTFLSKKFKNTDEYVNAVEKLFGDEMKKNGINVTLSDGLANKFKNYVKEKFELEPDLNPFTGKIDNTDLKVKSVESSEGSNPQSYLDKYSQEELEEMHGFAGWKPFGKQLNMMSGWKFHVFGEDLKDAIYLESVLKPIVDKWGAEAKVGGTNHTSGMYDSMKPGGVQYGKQGVTIYIPVDVINSGRQQDMLTDIQSAISGYKKGGEISGDKLITPSIHYRYEYVGPVPKDGLPRENARAMYNTNDGGSYKPDDVEDLFTKKLTDDEENVFEVNRDLYDEYMKAGNEDQMYDWLKTLPEDQMDDIYKHIEEIKLNRKPTEQGSLNKPKEVITKPTNQTTPPPQQQPRSPYNRYGAGSN
jgi:hypothetical protein